MMLLRASFFCREWERRRRFSVKPLASVGHPRRVADQDRVNKNATVFSIGTIALIVVIAAIVAGVWYFAHGRKSSKPPQETPRMTGAALATVRPLGGIFLRCD